MPAIRGLYRWFSRIAEYNSPTVADGDCTYTVHDPTARVNQVERWPVKSNADNYLYTIDWSFYAETDPIVASAWTLDGGLISWLSDFTAVITRNGVGFGKDRVLCNLTNTVTLASTAEYTQVVKIKIDNEVCVPRPTHGPSGAELACT